jgi:membrane protein YqaA with SNARE-associated domain
MEAPADAPAPAAPPTRNPLRRLYLWVLSWAHRPGGTWALLVLSFTESSFFPVPPDVLQIALSLQRPKRSFWYALVSSAASVLGGVAGYFIGWLAYDLVGRRIIDLYGLQKAFEQVGGYYQQQAFWWIVAAAFTPIPYKVFTIAAGVYHHVVPLWILVAASIVGRSARFFLVAALIWRFGAPVKGFIDKYFNLLTVIFTVLLVGGFLLIKMLW